MRIRTRWAVMATGGCLFTVALGLVGFILLSAPLGLWPADFEMSGGRVLDRGAVFHFEGDSLTVPIHLANSIPLVDVTVNGRGPYRFVLDTGAPETAMALDLCEELALPQLGSRTYTYDSRDLRVDERTFAVDSLRLGSAEVKYSWVPAFDAGDLREATGVELGGVLGLAPFMDGIVEIDLANHRLVLRKGRLRDTDDDALVPLTLNRRNPTVPVQIGDEVHPFKLDTGSNGCLSVTRAYAQTLRFRPGSETTSLAVGTTWAAHDATARLAAPVWLGSHEVTNARVSWPEDAPGKYLLGTGILRYFVVELDFVHEVARFSREEDGPIEIPDAWTLHLTVRIDPEGGLPRFVGGTLGDSDGNLWLRDGDVVESINGQSTKGLTQEELDRLLELKDTLVLQVDRKGTVMEVRITR